MIEIKNGSGFVVPLKKSKTGFRTAWGELEANTPKLPEDVQITRINSKLAVKQGSVGIGYVKVEEINDSSSGSARYLQVSLKEFRCKKHGQQSKSVSSSNYKSHVSRSHNDTATPRANQSGMPFAPKRNDQ